MSAHKIAVIAGDGIGPEVTREALKALEKVSEKLTEKLEIKNFELGAAHYLKTGETLTDAAFVEFAG